MNYQSKPMIWGCALAVALASITFAAENSAPDFKKAFSKVPPPELPAVAAKMVAEAPAKDQKSTAIGVVGAAVRKCSGCAPFVVSAVARAVPSVAAVAAATAAKLEPKQAGWISKAATAAAPSQAGDIVLAMSREVPGAYRIVAIGASEASPAANKQILAAVSQAIPNLKPFVEEASKAPVYTDSYASSVVGIIQHADALATASGAPLPSPLPSTTPLLAAAPAPPPPERPPKIPADGKPGSTNRAQVVVVQPGEGRIKYSGP